MGKYTTNGKQVLFETEDPDYFYSVADAAGNEEAHAIATALNSNAIVGNYIQDAMKTCSPDFHGDKVSRADFVAFMNYAIHSANQLDKVKKSLFYGRDNNLITGGLQPVSVILDKVQPNIVHGIIGIFTESGELLECLRDAYLGKGVDLVNMREEIGDLFWYVAILFAEASRYETGFTFEDAMRINIEKLKARFPDKFTSQDANERDLEKERKILEDK